jgi:hypothetical protein
VAGPGTGIPTLDELASEPLVHCFEDMFNPPGLTNFLGAAQVDHDLVATRSVSYPPLAGGDTVSGVLFLDGRLFRSLGAAVTVRWRPDRVVRSARVGDIAIETVTVCPPGETAVVVDICIRNLGGAARTVRLGLALASTVTLAREPWLEANPPSAANRVERAGSRLVGICDRTGAASVQGVDRCCSWIADAMLDLDVAVAPGDTARAGFVYALGATPADASQRFERLARDVPAAIAAAEALWAGEIAAAFEPESDSFSGALPVLETESEALRRLYWTGLLGVLVMRRDSPHSVLGRTYDTLMPRYWQTTTFVWDYSLSSILHALLDPEPMRRHLEHWIAMDVVHSHYGSEWLTGGPVGVWYSVNDYAMTRLVRDYVRYSGDATWLERELAAAGAPPRAVAEHVADWARHWRSLRGAGGLADYGGVDNLLECVSTYTHEVASLNAANAWCLRAAAEIAARGGRDDEAERLRAEAAVVVENVLELYVPGAGHWNARQPGGRLVPVRHCYDFQTTGSLLADDLGPTRRRELVDFFARELQTDTWMRALSASDPDAASSVRPDHQWNGAYTAWPAEAAQALFRLGAADVALDWLPGIAKSATQGPFAQAHFVEGLLPANHQGAPKAPPHFPYLIDWACSSSGAYVGLVLEGVFGIDVDLGGELRADPRVARLDPDARLRGLVVAGRRYDVDARGAVLRPSSRTRGTTSVAETHRSSLKQRVHAVPPHPRQTLPRHRAVRSVCRQSRNQRSRCSNADRCIARSNL